MDERNDAPSSERERKKRGPLGIIAGLFGRLFFLIGTLCLIGICSAGVFFMFFMTYVHRTLGPSLQVDPDDYTLNQSSIIYYHDDNFEENDGWVEYKDLHGNENRILIKYDQMAPALWQAAVAIEDHRFFEHKGVDWKRTGGAVIMTMGMQSSFGGSTITQQMLKNMTGAGENTVNRKVTEIFRALEFEKDHTKEEILELYLNTIYFGMGCYGVQTAAQYYFGKDAIDLSAAECASLIAITNNPSMYGPMYNITVKTKDADGNVIESTPREMNKKRQEMILERMYDPELGLCYLTYEEYEAAKNEELHFAERSGSAENLNLLTGQQEYNSWFMDQVINDVATDLVSQYGIDRKTAESWIYNRGYQIYTTLDPKIQAIADEVYVNRKNLPLTSADGQQIRSAITILDPYTGNIVAIVGDMGEKVGNRLLSFASIKKQPGSSIKPLTVYSPALDAGVVTPASAIDDYPVMKYNGSAWPRNDAGGYKGMTNIRDGVRRSVNTVAIRTLQALGVENSYEFATKKLNLSLVEDDMSLAPLGLGGLTEGLSTIEMAAGYGAIANHGVYNRPRTYLRVIDSKGRTVIEKPFGGELAIKETTAYLMTNMLQGVVASGTGTSAKFDNMHIAGKTGTTSDNYARYFVGYTPYYVAAVWVGYERNATIKYSGNPAITMWKKVMQRVHEDLPDQEFYKPDNGLETVTVCADSGKLATKACRNDLRGSRLIEVEIGAGTAPTENCDVHVSKRYCTRGHVVAGTSCPSSSCTTVGLLNISRERLGASADDSAYLLSAHDGRCSVHYGSSGSSSSSSSSSKSSSSSSSSKSSSSSSSSKSTSTSKKSTSSSKSSSSSSSSKSSGSSSSKSSGSSSSGSKKTTNNNNWESQTPSSGGGGGGGDWTDAYW